MTDEEDFQRHLDEHPDDSVARLVFADWLEERGDPRAEGYRALGHLRKWARGNPSVRFTYDSSAGNRILWKCHGTLPLDWYIIADPDYLKPGVGPFYTTKRNEAEDAAALAFAKLPPERRAELLSTNTSEVTA